MNILKSVFNALKSTDRPISKHNLPAGNNTGKTTKSISSLLLFTALLLSGNIYGQNGYIYVHNKTLNEETAVDFNYTLTNTTTNVTRTFKLNDNPNYLLLGDLGTSHTATTTGAVNADGELWAIGSTTACCTDPVATPDNNPLDPAHIKGSVYRRAAGSSQWTKAYTGTVIAVDGAYANQCVFATANGIFFYNAGTLTTLSTASNVIDVTAGGGRIAAIFTNGSVQTYSNTYSEGTAPSTGGSWATIVSSGQAERLDLKKDGSSIVYIKDYTVRTIAFGGGSSAKVYNTDVPGTGESISKDVTFDDNDVIYAIGTVGQTPVVFNTLSTTWTAEMRSQNTTRITAGAGGQVWAVYGSSNYTGSFVNSILARTTQLNSAADGYGAGAIWYDDERVHTAAEGNAFSGAARTALGNGIMIPVPAGTYNLSEAYPDNTWEIRRINVYDPTTNSTANVANATTAVNVKAGEVVTVEYVNEKLIPISVPNTCGTNTIENFGSGSAAYGQPLSGSAYHYKNTTRPEDGDYMIVKNITTGNWFNNMSGLTDHTGLTNGYFMMVNASYAQDEFYRKRITGLVVGQKYTLSFWTTAISSGVPSDVTFGLQALNGTILGSTVTGTLPVSATWQQYSFTFTATVTTADVYLLNNSIGGDGNDLVIDDIALNLAAPGKPTPTATSKSNVCPVNTVNLTTLQPTATQGQSFEWRNASNVVVGDPTAVAASGTYYLYTQLTGSGCYSTASNAVTVSITSCPSIITGKVWNDANGNIGIDLNEAGTNTGTSLYVYLTDASGNIKAKTTVAADGTYSLTAPLNNTSYTLQLSTVSYTLNTNPGTINTTPPAGWVTTGENGNGSSDGTANGKLSINSGAGGLANQNFGIEQPPVAGSGINSAVNPGGTISVPVPANTFTNINTSTDPSTGVVSYIRLTSFPSNATSITINGVTYTSFTTALQNLQIPVDTLGNPAVPVSVDPSFNGADSCVFQFKAIDNAGVASLNTGTATMVFGTGIQISGNVINDVNGNTRTDGSETNTTADTTLYVYLVDAAGNIADSATVGANGKYTLDALSNKNYTILLSTVKYTIGTNTNVTPIDVTLPAGWVTTGENGSGNNTGNGDGNADGKLAVTTGNTAVINMNFGIEELPTPGKGNNNAVNPGGTNNAAVPANTFTNNSGSSDLTNGIVTSIRIVEFPSNTTTITIGNTKYNANVPADVAALLALNIPTDATGKPNIPISIDPSEEGTVVSTISFLAKDNAGKESTDTGKAVMNFDDGITISGTLFDDANGNTRIDGSETGTGAGTTYVYLADAANNIVDSTRVLSNGTYSLKGLPSTDYTLYLSKTAYAEGTNIVTTPINTALSNGWVTTGENGSGNNTGSGDGTKDGKLQLTTGTDNKVNQNFGIEQLPFSDNKVYSIGTSAYSSVPPAGYPSITNFVSIVANSGSLTGYPAGGSLTGSDPEDCAAASSCTIGKTFVFETINANTRLYYNTGSGIVAVTPGMSIPNFNAGKLVIYGKIGSGNNGDAVGFTYSLVDAAGNKSAAPATYAIISSTPLPLVLLNFGAKLINTTVQTNWETALEQDIQSFEVERSTNGETFTSIGVVNAAGSNSTYTFTDEHPVAGINYYRLRIYETTGTVSLSKVVTVKTNNVTATSITVYPNPVTDVINVHGSTGKTTAQLYNQSGQMVKQATANDDIMMNVTDLQPGLYVIKITDEDGTTVTKQLIKR